ncbi:MAG: ATP-dependent RNA helicase HrpA, partial [Zoogloeaceae bacterium]|nr:ATP-dependent RNA helicase HrpA [Zoogloeaceae bacterium]
TGLARVKRYSYRNKVEQLRVEKISQAAARQRAGRCGRVAAGVCIRLYDEADFNARPAFTDPEILRSSLAGVILRMKALKLTDVERFPFLEAPPEKAIKDGYALLAELGALDAHRGLTETGRMLARLPLDPRIARMIVAARERGCLKEVLVIAAALSVQDPRERPPEKQQQADEAQRRIMGGEGKSEFLDWLRLWDWFAQETAHKKSNKKLIERCRANYLSFLRLREWREAHGQLHALVAEAGWRENDIPASYEAIHKALLAGLLGNFGCKADEAGHYLGARGIRFFIHPASRLQKKAGKWLLAAEIAETSRLYGRCIAAIEPAWLEEVGAHLLKRQYLDPHWEKKAMQVVAAERTTLHGVVIDPGRRVHYGPIDPVQSREVFIRQCLVAGEAADEAVRRWGFFRHNRQLVAEIEKIEHKQRRPDVLVDDELIVAFYDRLIPEGIVNGAGFDQWRRQAEGENPKLLYLEKSALMRHEAAGITTETYPAKLALPGGVFALSYHFEPGSPKDGVTLIAPLTQLNALSAPALEWLVPGLIKEKIVQLLKTLPQKIRAKLVPLPDFAEGFLVWVNEDETRKKAGLLPPLIDFILKSTPVGARGWTVSPDSFRPDALPAHLFMNIRLIDEHGRQLDLSRDLGALKAEWGAEARAQFADLPQTPAGVRGLVDWTFGELPELMEISNGGQSLIGYPALEDQGESVDLQVFDDPEEARRIHEGGLLRLFMLQLAAQAKALDKGVPAALAMQFMNLGTAQELKTQLTRLAFARACLTAPWPTTPEAFKERVLAARQKLGLIAQECLRLTAEILMQWQAALKKLGTLKGQAEAKQDIEAQLARLMTPRFLVETPFERLQHFPRYLKAIQLRIDKLRADPARDARLLAEYQPLWLPYERRARELAKARRTDAQAEQFRWLLEELRVSLFAQELKTPTPVSVKRLTKMWAGIRY